MPKNSVQGELEQERSLTARLKKNNSQLASDLYSIRARGVLRIPFIDDVGHFLLERAPTLTCGGTNPEPGNQHRVAFPLLALEWPPHANPDVIPAWRACIASGALGLFGRLCTGNLQPSTSELELSVSNVHGRWFGAVGGGAEVQRFAALMLFQALRLDITVFCTCRIMPSPLPLLNAVSELCPDHRSVPRLGSEHQICKAPPTTDEALVRRLLAGCPFEVMMLSTLASLHKAC